MFLIAMASTTTIEVLNRVLAILCRSFPQYLQFSRPYVPSGNDQILETLEEIVSGQNALADRVARLIEESGGLADRGEFPMAFTDAHDVEIHFAIARAVDYQQQDIASLAECTRELGLAPAALSLAEEARGMPKGHLESLQELSGEPRAATSA